MEPNVSCGACLGGPRRATCQLYVGHNGEHGALVLTERGRMLRRWATSPESSDVEFSPDVAAGLPWAPGQPLATGTVQPNLTLLADRADRADRAGRPETDEAPPAAEAAKAANAAKASKAPEAPERSVRPARQPRRLRVAPQESEAS
jgi:hypothetical protein